MENFCKFRAVSVDFGPLGENIYNLILGSFESIWGRLLKVCWKFRAVLVDFEAFGGKF